AVEQRRHPVGAPRHEDAHRNQRCEQEQLVGERIEKPARVGDGVPGPGEMAVHVVRYSRDDVERERRVPDRGRGKERKHPYERSRRDSSHGYGIRKIHFPYASDFSTILLTALSVSNTPSP